ncbi:hypothetical protein J437_LFUL014487 [Ladona fulva]|uniref:Uncharacterized protein n=1 Tax=Ladona fulva TaxID=123851 RepID=A0A8K0P8R6_LADFU|nr:hypothetical protein J437_LFUL014487 [Ladona fulva]
MYFRGIIIKQLKRFSTRSEVMFSSKLNSNTRPYLWNLRKFSPSLHFDSVGKPKQTSSGRFLRTCSCLRSMNEKEVKRQMDEISDKFGEAMELLSDARNSMGTVYFSDDMTDAEVMVDEVCKDYEKLLSDLDSGQSGKVTRAIGLKVEELKAQLQLLKESIKE